jgi:transglutaminase-like putative cysteine protease
MKLIIATHLEYRLAGEGDVLLQIEAARLPGQEIGAASLRIGDDLPLTRVAGHDGIGERLWVGARGRLVVDYAAEVTLDRPAGDLAAAATVPFPRLPAEVIPYLMGSRYCPSDRFQAFVQQEFGTLDGGARICAMRDWIRDHFSYVPGASCSDTTAVDSFVARSGVCRDFAHVLISLARVSGIPARMASVYAPEVKPQDFHAVAEVYLGDGWHLVDPTGMAEAEAMAHIAVGRDAADVAFMTSYQVASLVAQTVSVSAA